MNKNNTENAETKRFLSKVSVLKMKIRKKEKVQLMVENMNRGIPPPKKFYEYNKFCRTPKNLSSYFNRQQDSSITKNSTLEKKVDSTFSLVSKRITKKKPIVLSRNVSDGFFFQKKNKQKEVFYSKNDETKNKYMIQKYLNDATIKSPRSAVLKKRNFSCISKSTINFSNLKKSTSNETKNLKVKNLPLYTIKIGYFKTQIKNIKKQIETEKKKYKKRHFMTYNEIDDLMKVRLDMKMLRLKQKFFNCRFPPEQQPPKETLKKFASKMKMAVENIEYEMYKNLFVKY